MKYIINTILFCVILFTGELFAQMSEVDVRKAIANEWIHQPVSTAAGESASGKCDGGKSYKFATTGKVEIQECNKGYMRTLQQSWTLKAVDHGGWLLTVDSSIYRLEFLAQTGKETIKLTPISNEVEGAIQRPVVKLYRLVAAPVGKEVEEIEN